MKTRVKRLGVISIDSGTCWVGDPCYILHTDTPNKSIGESWDSFCDEMDRLGFEAEQSAQFSHGPKAPGLGVITSTGWGDGVYPVYGTFDIDSGRLMKVIIDFNEVIEEEDDHLIDNPEEKDEED